MTEYLTANHDAVLEVLHRLNFTNISHNKTKKEVRFSREEGRNPSAVLLNLQTLSFYVFSTNEKGNLYTLVMNKKMLRFPKALEWVANVTGIEKSLLNMKTRLPFGGFYKNLIREIQEPEYSMQTYDEEAFREYFNKHNTMFFNDGIDFETQRFFNIGYDLATNSILIPEYTLDGQLCGIQARTNDINCEHDKRWWAWLPCSRSLTLYGYHINYQYIQQKNLCIIPEAEKSIMKLYQIGCRNAVALCGCIASDTQIKHLKAMMVDKYIFCLDEGINEDNVREQCNLLKIKNQIFENKVGYVFDKENKYLPKGSKLSPCDMPKEIFTKILKECTVWI